MKFLILISFSNGLFLQLERIRNSIRLCGQKHIFITNIEATTHNIALYGSNTIDLNDSTSLNLSGRWNWASLKMEDQYGTALEGHHFFNEFNPGVASDPDFNMKLWKLGIRVFKGINKFKGLFLQALPTGLG